MKKRILFLLIIMILPFLFGCSNKENDGINSLEELQSKPYVIGVPYLTYLAEQAKDEFPLSTDFRSFNDMTAAYQALQQNKIDALLQDETMARVEISNGVEGVKILNDKLNISSTVACGISPKSVVANEKNINECLNELLSNGIIDDMEKRWVDDANYAMPEIELPKGDAPVLKVCTCGIVEPFSFYKDGAITGFDIELASRIAKKLNCKVEFEINPDFDSLIASTQSGKSDLLISNLYVTEERKQQMPLSIPYLNRNGCVVVKDYTNNSYLSLSELNNKKIGYEYSSVQFANQIDKYIPSAQHVLYNTTADSIIGLMSNRIDAFVTDLPNAKYVVDVTDGLKILPEYMDKDDYGFLFQKDSPLTSEFNRVLEEFKKNNVLKDLEDKWYSDVTNPNKQTTKQDPTKSYTKTIKAVTTGLVKPVAFLNENNEICGYDADLLIMICEELNYKVEFMPCVSDIGSILSEVETGHADIGFNCISITDERKQNFDFCNPIYEGAAVLIVRDNISENKGFFEKLKNSFKKTFVVEKRWKMIFDGMIMTLVISLSSGVLGILLGFFLCVLKRGKNKPIKTTLRAITKIVQGTPIVVFLMIMYYIIFGKIDISAVIVCILAFGINFGIYASEIMKSGFDTVDIGQVEASRALGYSKSQTFFKISFPQAASKFLPVLRGEFISMVKMTSIAGYISVAELTRVGDVIRSKTMEAFFPLIAIALIYFGLAELLTFGLSLLEKKLDYKNKSFKLRSILWKKKF